MMCFEKPMRRQCGGVERGFRFGGGTCDGQTLFAITVELEAITGVTLGWKFRGFQGGGRFI